MYPPVNLKQWWGHHSARWKLSVGGQTTLTMELHDLLSFWFDGPQDNEPLQWEVHPADVTQVIG